MSLKIQSLEEQPVYIKDDIVITGFRTDDGLWLFNKEVKNWSVSTYKRWLSAIAEILDAARDNDVYELFVYVKDKKAERFATMLGFTPHSEMNEILIMSQRTS